MDTYHKEVAEYIDRAEDEIRKAKARARAKVRRLAMKAAMDSVGMVRVRGNLGGEYWE